MKEISFMNNAIYRDYVHFSGFKEIWYEPEIGLCATDGRTMHWISDLTQGVQGIPSTGCFVTLKEDKHKCLVIEPMDSMGDIQAPNYKRVLAAHTLPVELTKTHTLSLSNKVSINTEIIRFSIVSGIPINLKYFMNLKGFVWTVRYHKEDTTKAVFFTTHTYSGVLHAMIMPFILGE